MALERGRFKGVLGLGGDVEGSRSRLGVGRPTASGRQNGEWVRVIGGQTTRMTDARGRRGSSRVKGQKGQHVIRGGLSALAMCSFRV